MTAAEFMAELEADPEYQRAKTEREASTERQVHEWALAEAPIVEDLRAAGLQVESVWDLVMRSEPYPEAFAVLVGHLERGEYPDRVMEGAARSLGVSPAVAYWDRVRDLYLRRPLGRGVDDGLAVALAGMATKEQLQDLLALAGNEELGESRILLLGAIKRVGGVQGRKFLEQLATDPQLGLEASSLTKSRARRRAR